MSCDTVERLLCCGDPDHRVANGGRAGSDFAHLRTRRGGGATERASDCRDHKQRHEVRVLPRDTERPGHNAVAYLVQHLERDHHVADKQPGAADVFETNRRCRLRRWHPSQTHGLPGPPTMSERCPFTIPEGYPGSPNNALLLRSRTSSLAPSALSRLCAAAFSPAGYPFESGRASSAPLRLGEEPGATGTRGRHKGAARCGTEPQAARPSSPSSLPVLTGRGRGPRT